MAHWTEHMSPGQHIGVRYCPVCADAVLQATGECIRGCQWPPCRAMRPLQQGVGDERLAETWVTKASTESLKETARTLRHLLHEIAAEIDVRDARQTAVALARRDSDWTTGLRPSGSQAPR